ncbi:MAG: hypothetical protein ACLQVY_26130 [Limisphaerales bacterium]
MAFPIEQLVIVGPDGKRIDVEKMTEELRQDEKRVLIDDELGVVIYVGDLDLYSLKPLENGEYLAQKLREISRPRFSTQLVRHQIGPTVFSMTADTVFLIREGETIKKVRADKLKKGITLANGDKVFS